MKVELYYHPSRQADAEQLANRFDLPLTSKQSKNSHQLYLGVERLELQDLRSPAPGPISVDFTSGKARHRRLYGGGKNQPLMRALGYQKSGSLKLLDATAGLARDAFVAASLGCQVMMVERSACFAALIADGLNRAMADADTQTITKNMQLIHKDSITALQNLVDSFNPDTIYLDPMYPHRNKSALVKKEMTYTRELVGSDEDADQLLDTACQSAVHRVAVKRPLNAPNLNSQKPDTIIYNKNTRFDIYINNTNAA